MLLYVFYISYLIVFVRFKGLTADLHILIYFLFNCCLYLMNERAYTYTIIFFNILFLF